MTVLQKLFGLARRFDEPQLLSNGWDRYARRWRADRCEIVAGQTVQFLGDEWTHEDASTAGSSYGLAPEILEHFGRYLAEQLVDRYLPAQAEQGLEIGPGGGRLTELLLPRAQVLHVADAAPAMLRRLKQRFAAAPQLRFHHTDGMNLPPLPDASLDFVAAFDVFVHFEPRLVFWYLRQIAVRLKPGGVGVIHYANVLTPGGWQQFERHLERNVKQRTFFAAFGTMCPELMARFVGTLGLELVSSDVGIVPRDAVAVFRKP